MTTHLLLSALLLVACGDNLEPDQDGLATAAGGEATPADTPENPLFVGFTSFPNSCADNSVELRARFSYADGTEVENPFCHFVLQDGTVIDSCFSYHSFPTPQTVALTVTDLDTGATGYFEEKGVQGPGNLDVTLDIATDGLSISWEAHALYGDTVDTTPISISINPSENVIVDDSNVFLKTSGTVKVTAAGTYTVEASTGITFAEVGGCSAFTHKAIEVTCNGDEHTH